MNKEEKKLRKKLDKMEKKREKKAEKKSWAKYKPAGCYKCSSGQLYSGGACELSVTYYRRCKCSRIKTKKYKKFIKDRDKMLMKGYSKMNAKFYDNNDHITVGNNATDRSW